MSIFINFEITWYCYEKALLPCCPPFERAWGQCPHHASAFRRRWFHPQVGSDRKFELDFLDRTSRTTWSFYFCFFQVNQKKCLLLSVLVVFQTPILQCVMVNHFLCPCVVRLCLWYETRVSNKQIIIILWNYFCQKAKYVAGTLCTGLCNYLKTF